MTYGTSNNMDESQYYANLKKIDKKYILYASICIQFILHAQLCVF